MMSPAYSPQAQAITPSHYCDVVDERNIEHLCGYPPCGTRLGPVTAQRYHISLEKKQVYDLAERKKFCSMHCYKASMFYASQLSSEPLWLRTSSHTPSGHTSASTSALLHGEDIEKVSRDIATITFEEARRESREADREEAGEEEEEAGEEEEEAGEEEEEAGEEEEEVKKKEEEKEGGKECHQEVRLSKEASTPAANMSSSTSKIVNAFTTWTTALLEPSDKQEVGVPTKSHTPSLLTDQEELGTKRDIFLPPVHSLSVTQVQRNIFMGQLKRSLLGVTSELGLGTSEVLTKVTELVHRFRLNRHTITFNPKEWKVILLVLIASLYPDQDLVSTHQMTIDQWLANVGASRQDLELMLTACKS
eukprot:Em0009g52a